MAIHKLAVIIKNPSNDDEFLLLKQTPPPKFGDQEYDSLVDSDLWDLPSAELNSLQGDSHSGILIQAAESCSEKLDLKKFDLNSAINSVLLNESPFFFGFELYTFNYNFLLMLLLLMMI